MKETVLLNPSMDPQVFLPRQFRRHIFTNVQVRTQHSEAHPEQLKYAFQFYSPVNSPVPKLNRP